MRSISNAPVQRQVKKKIKLTLLRDFNESNEDKVNAPIGFLIFLGSIKREHWSVLYKPLMPGGNKRL